MKQIPGYCQECGRRRFFDIHGRISKCEICGNPEKTDKLAAEFQSEICLMEQAAAHGF